MSVLTITANNPIPRESPYGGWQGTNLAIGGEVRIRGAACLRRPANQQ